MADKIKFVLAILLVVAGLAGYHLLAEQALVVRVLVVLFALAVAFLVFLKTATGARLIEFSGDAWREVRKVVWPSRKETVQTTAMVFVFVVVMALFLYVTDKSLEWVMYDLVLGWRKS